MPEQDAEMHSANAIRIKRYRERQTAVGRLERAATFDNLWEALLLFQAYPFYTVKGLRFTYEIHGGEIRVSRKEKTITKSSVEIAYQRALQLRNVSGPKELGVFGASYLYPVFLRLGVIAPQENPKKQRQG